MTRPPLVTALVALALIASPLTASVAVQAADAKTCDELKASLIATAQEASKPDATDTQKINAAQTIAAIVKAHPECKFDLGN